ncbi:MAG: ABC transporter ATP-binding protein [Candidatus Promineifilaceae bacterium]
MPNNKKTERTERIRRYLSPRSQLGQLRYVPRALKFVWDAAASWTMASLVILVIQGILPVLTVILTRYVIDSLIVAIDSNGNWNLIQPALIYILLLGTVMMVHELIGNLKNYVNTYMVDRTKDYMFRFIHEKTSSVDMEFYESAAYYDQLSRASSDAMSQPLNLLNNITSFLQAVITLVAMIGILFSFAWWIPLVLLLGAIPAFVVSVSLSRKIFSWRLLNTLNQRRLGYYNTVLTSDKAAAELRLYKLDDHFKPAHTQLRRRLRKERLDIHTKGLLGQIAASLSGMLTLALVMAWVGWRALAGYFSLGDMTMFWQAINQGRQLIGNLLSGVDSIYRNLLFLEDLFQFLDTEPHMVDPDEPVEVPPLEKEITLKDVTFYYPGSERTALEHFNLTIPSGKFVAIVGENGAGKSTLLKLLCRFYDPQEGTIYWDGVNLKDVKQAELRRHISVLFQQPFAYHDSAANNIRFGNLNGDTTQSDIEKAARAGGAHSIIAELPEGYDTILGKWFGNTELSVGEWQRVALARAFMRKSNLVILDEPTSAMDSWAEYEWMSRVRNLVGGRTAVIITHRFTTAMQADIIHVMIDGRVVESGTHNELVALDGRYAKSWRQQMDDAEWTNGSPTLKPEDDAD